MTGIGDCGELEHQCALIPAQPPSVGQIPATGTPLPGEPTSEILQRPRRLGRNAMECEPALEQQAPVAEAEPAEAFTPENQGGVCGGGEQAPQG
jgi:hypothetical protein